MSYIYRWYSSFHQQLLSRGIISRLSTWVLFNASERAPVFYAACVVSAAGTPPPPPRH